jgi:preprotein translocase subunit SecG
MICVSGFFHVVSLALSFLHANKDKFEIKTTKTNRMYIISSWTDANVATNGGF